METIGNILNRANFRRTIKFAKRIKNISYTDIATLDILLGLAKKTKKWYCYPSQNFILDKLAAFKKLPISLRTLNYHLAYLESKGYIRRQRRLSRGRLGQLITRSTLYFFTSKAINIVKHQIKRAQQFVKAFPSFKLTLAFDTGIKPEDMNKEISQEELAKRAKFVYENL